MDTTYTIGQLARAAGVPTSTVRYYERIELLQPAGRTAGNYRLYGEDALRMTDLRHVQRVLKATLESCRQAAWQGHCQVIERLTATSVSHP